VAVRVAPHDAAAAADRVVPMEQFVELSRPGGGATGAIPATMPSAARFELQLTSGDRIAGDPVGVKGDAVVWKNATVGELAIPLRTRRVCTHRRAPPPAPPTPPAPRRSPSAPANPAASSWPASPVSSRSTVP